MTLQLIILIILGILPSLTWLLFYLKEDPHPEPKPWIFVAFLAGMGAVPVALILEKYFMQFMPPIPQPPLSNLTLNIIFIFITVAFIEEVTKFIAMRTLLWRNPIFDEAVDAMIYMVISGLGFAAFENMALLSNLDWSLFWSQGVPTLVLRFIGATFLHTLASGIIGYGWAISLTINPKSKKILALWSGILCATALHAAFNLLVLRLGMLYLFPSTLLLFVAGLLVLHEFDILKSLKKQINYT